MDSVNSNRLKPLGSLQLMAVIMVVIVHFGRSDCFFMGVHWMTFCFIYSGFFTAMHHRFGPGYSLRDHGRFMWKKVAKLYPLHLLGIVWGIVVAWLVWDVHTVNLKALLAQLTLTSPWIPDRQYYFAINPVAWYISDLFFLYLTAPLLVRLLRRCRPALQAVAVIVLLALEFTAGYCMTGENGMTATGLYLLFEFPPIRLLDFAIGIVLYNLTRETWWTRLQSRVTTRNATIIELGGIATAAILFQIEKLFLFDHCYRACCVVAPGIVVLLATFLLTAANGGLVSRALSLKPVVALTTIGAEIYLLQYDVYFLMDPAFQRLGLHLYDAKQFILYLAVLLLVAVLTHRFFTTPVKNWLLSKDWLRPTDQGHR